jgi:hypothetical protein
MMQGSITGHTRATAKSEAHPRPLEDHRWDDAREMEAREHMRMPVAIPHREGRREAK